MKRFNVNPLEIQYGAEDQYGCTGLPYIYVYTKGNGVLSVFDSFGVRLGKYYFSQTRNGKKYQVPFSFRVVSPTRCLVHCDHLTESYLWDLPTDELISVNIPLCRISSNQRDRILSLDREYLNVYDFNGTLFSRSLLPPPHYWISLIVSSSGTIYLFNLIRVLIFSH